MYLDQLQNYLRTLLTRAKWWCSGFNETNFCSFVYYVSAAANFRPTRDAVYLVETLQTAGSEMLAWV